MRLIIKKLRFLISIILISTLFVSVSSLVHAESDNSDEERGKFYFKIIPSDNKEDQEIAAYIIKKGTFKKIVKALNETLVIPYDIRIVLTNTKHGPHYQPANKLIVLDYGDERWSAEQFDKNYPDADKETRDHYLNNINLFSLYHELGHALIDAYNIPVLGKEEDAADNMAAVIILYYFKHGDQILLDNADYFERARESGSSQENQYWDVHALSAQRYYQLLCYAYASSPESVAEVLKEKDNQSHTLAKFIEEKKDYCIYEYKKMSEIWFTLLKPHFKDGSKADAAIKEINGEDQESPVDNSEN